MSGCSHLRKIAAHYIYTPTGLSKKRVVVVDPTGTILALEEYPSQGLDASAGVEFYNGVILPGLVNAHTHLELSYLKGEIESGGGFAEFARKIAQRRGAFTEQQIVDAAELEDAKMWRQGVQVVGDISNSTATFNLKRGSKIHYHTFIEVFGLRLESIDQAAWSLIDTDLEQSITPHSTYSLNERVFREALEAHENGRLSIHFMESVAESELYRGEGDLMKMFNQNGLINDFAQRYSSPTERVIQNIGGERKILLIHNTHITKEDVERLQGHFGENLTWVVCPQSNRYIADQAPPYGLLLSAGGRVAIGTDSLASNTNLSIIDELKIIPKSISLEKLLSIATKEGAQALGLESRYGTIEVGKAPGIVLLEGVDWQKMELKPNATTRRLV